jgi:hypothetical protein
VLAFSDALACGDSVEAELRTVASNVESVVICGHYPAQERPEALLDRDVGNAWQSSRAARGGLTG